MADKWSRQRERPLDCTTRRLIHRLGAPAMPLTLAESVRHEINTPTSPPETIGTERDSFGWGVAKRSANRSPVGHLAGRRSAPISPVAGSLSTASALSGIRRKADSLDVHLPTGITHIQTTSILKNHYANVCFSSRFLLPPTDCSSRPLSRSSSYVSSTQPPATISISISNALCLGLY